MRRGVRYDFTARARAIERPGGERENKEREGGLVDFDETFDSMLSLAVYRFINVRATVVSLSLRLVAGKRITGHDATFSSGARPDALTNDLRIVREENSLR